MWHCRCFRGSLLSWLPSLRAPRVQVTGNLDAVQALLRAGASIMVKSGGCCCILEGGY